MDLDHDDCNATARHGRYAFCDVSDALGSRDRPFIGDVISTGAPLVVWSCARRHRRQRS